MKFFRDIEKVGSLGILDYAQIVLPPNGEMLFPATPFMYKALRVWYVDDDGDKFCSDFCLFPEVCSTLVFDERTSPVSVLPPTGRRFDHNNPQTDEEYEASH